MSDRTFQELSSQQATKDDENCLFVCFFLGNMQGLKNLGLLSYSFLVQAGKRNQFSQEVHAVCRATKNRVLCLQ